MARPAFFSDGHTPNRTDSKWRIRAKWLGMVQDANSGDSANDPKRRDTRWVQKEKINKALTGN